MGVLVRKQVDKLDGQTELYLVLCLLAIALLMILGLVACNCALTCCRSNTRKKERRRSFEDDYDADYFRQIRSLLQRQQIVERQWEERRRIREEYRLLSPEQAAASLSQLTSRASSPARPKRSTVKKSSLKSENDLKDELANYKVNHTVRIREPNEMSPYMKRRSWSAILDEKEIELNEEDVIGGSMVIVRRYEPMKMIDTVRKPSIKKDRQKTTILVGSSSKKRQQKPSIETIV
ncbi:hypothetical protein M3Y97_00047200 [Aphelenchoides bicaudatus]|nr:hypothetical protein M3Y97_00047200 [Aphelenchoides bicaudatus]